MTRLDVRRCFDPTPAAVREARTFLRECLGHVRPTDGLDLDMVVMAANELATNAVLHGRTEFEVRVASDDAVLCVEVRDHNVRLPEPCLAAPAATSGRGLMLVEHTGLRWGVEPHEDGKTVWLRAPLRSADVPSRPVATGRPVPRLRTRVIRLP